LITGTQGLDGSINFPGSKLVYLLIGLSPISNPKVYWEISSNTFCWLSPSRHRFSYRSQPGKEKITPIITWPMEMGFFCSINQIKDGFWKSQCTLSSC